MRMISNKPNFKKVYEIANEMLIRTNCINDFPYSVKALAKEQADVQVVSYKKAKEKYDIPIDKFGSVSAHLEKCNGAHIIFFNNEDCKQRIRFSLGHELGHVVSGHKMDLDEHDPIYAKQEIEANYFAAQILMPDQIIRECENRGYRITDEYLVSSFGVSHEAARKRRDSLSSFKWRDKSEKQFDDIILYLYKDFIDKIAPNKNVFMYDIETDILMQNERDTWNSYR